MSQDTEREHISKKRVVYTMPGVEAVRIRRNHEYRVPDAGALTMDLYYPPDSKSGTRAPAVLFVTGYSDVGAEKMLGCQFKDMGSFVSWAELAAASGLVAVTYANREPADVHAALQHLRQNAASLDVDENRIGLWACSGHGPNALSVLMQVTEPALTCAVLCYPYTLDGNGFTAVADAARRWGFANPCAGKSAGDLPRDTPLFLVRAGRDQMPGLNEALDRFVVAALSDNLPITCVNHAAAPHAFDLFDDSETSREIIRQVLGFLRFHLRASSHHAALDG